MASHDRSTLFALRYIVLSILDLLVVRDLEELPSAWLFVLASTSHVTIVTMNFIHVIGKGIVEGALYFIWMVSLLKGLASL